MAKFKISIEANSDEGVYYWNIQLGNDSKHDNSRDAYDIQNISTIIGRAVNDIDNALLNRNNTKED